jgi:hypothetical protein
VDTEIAASQTPEIVYEVHNGINPAPYRIVVLHEVDTDQYYITLTILGKNFSRIEKTKGRAVLYAKDMNSHLEDAFKYTWEDNA